MTTEHTGSGILLLMEPLKIPHPTPEMAKTAGQTLIDKIALAFQRLPDERKPGNNRKDSQGGRW